MGGSLPRNLGSELPTAAVASDHTLGDFQEQKSPPRSVEARGPEGSVWPCSLCILGEGPS